MKKEMSKAERVEQILQKKNYLNKNVNSPNNLLKNNFSMAWMELLFVLMVFVAGLGEWKKINIVLGGLPKAITLGVVALAVIYALVTSDLSGMRVVRKPLFMYLLLLGSIVGCTMIIWMKNFTAFSSMTRGSSKIIFQFVAVIVAVCAAYLFKERSIDLFAMGICSANLAIMLFEIPNYGFSSSMQSLFHVIITLGDAAGYAEALEIHEMTFLYGIFIVYYGMFAPKETQRQKKTRTVLLCMSIFLLLSGMKRIMIPACILSLLYVLLIRKRKNIFAIVMATGIFWVVFFVFYLYAVRYGLISLLAEKLNINMMGRDYIWKLAEPFYSLSPGFTGLGFEAVDAIVKQLHYLGLIDTAYPFHNDILKVFVELGFYGFFLWSGIQYILFPWFWAKQFNSKAALLYMSTLNVMTFTYLTDNTAFYFWCTIALRLTTLAYVFTIKRADDENKWRAPEKTRVQRLIDESIEEM